jgi:hypothetical protein
VGARNRGSARHHDSGRAQGAGGIGNRAAGRHQIVNDHHRPLGSGQRRRSSRIGGELARRGPPALDRGQRGAVRAVGGQPKNRRGLRDDPGPGESADRASGEPLDVLPAASPGHSRGRGHRDQPDQPRPGKQRLDGGGQCDRQRRREIPAATLLVREQAGSHRSAVRGGDGQGRQPGRHRIGPVPAGMVQGPPAPPAHGSARVGAAGAAARQDEVGQHGDHATTVPVRVARGQSECAICG